MNQDMVTELLNSFFFLGIKDKEQKQIILNVLIIALTEEMQYLAIEGAV